MRLWLGTALLTTTVAGSAAAQPGAEKPAEPTEASPAAEAQAGVPGASLEFVKCKGLDVAETERLLRVELAVIAARVERARAPSVRVECKKDVLHIEVKDPASGGMKALTLPAPRANTQDRERTVALAASQLFLSSWLEMITGKAPEQPRKRAPAPAQKSVTPPAVRAEVADAGADTQYQPGPTSWELWASGGAHFRHLGSGVRTLSPSLLLRRRFQQRWLLGGLIGWETAETARVSGAIDWYAGRAGASFGMRAGSGWAFVDALVCTSLLWVRASGNPTSSGVRGDERDAAAFDLSLELAPTLAFSRMRVGLIGQLGFVTPNVTARAAGDRPLRFDGPWAGVGLALGGEIAR